MLYLHYSYCVCVSVHIIYMEIVYSKWWNAENKHKLCKPQMHKTKIAYADVNLRFEI